MAPSRRRPATAGGTKDKGGVLSPNADSGSPGSPALVLSPRGAGGGGGGGNTSHHHHHHKSGNNPNNNAQSLTSLDLDALDDEAAAARFDSMSESVVKIFCIHSEPNFNQPWTKRRQTSSTSSGFAIPGRRILTNAHSVDHHVSVKCRRRGSDAKVVARVLAIGVECDLALLAVDGDDADEFWRGLQGVTLCRSLPRLQESVSVCGFPLGGDTLSVTSGVVSRCETTNYVHGGVMGSELLGIQIDAAINSGNSGGPVFNSRGECVGVAFQSMSGSGEAEGIGWIIPVLVLEHFLEDFRRNGRFLGFPCLGVEWQKMESPSLRAALKMNSSSGGGGGCDRGGGGGGSGRGRGGVAPSSSSSSLLLKGVYCRKVEPTAPVAAVVKAGDVLLAFDDVEIGVDGTVPFRSGERISYSFLVSRKFIGDRANLRLLRDGEVMEVETELAAPYRLVPAHLSGKPPSYFVFGGLVFTALSAPYLRATYGKDFDYDSPLPLLTNYMLKSATHREQQAVILSQVLASNVTLGAEDIVDCQVHRVNGQPIDSLRSLVRLLDGLKVEEEDEKAGGRRKGKAPAAAAAKKACAGKNKPEPQGTIAAAAAASGSSRYAFFELDYDQLVVLDVAAARAANASILEQHSIAVDRSPDLRAEAATAAGTAVGAAPAPAAAAPAAAAPAAAAAADDGEKEEDEERAAAAAAAGSKKRRAAATTTAAKQPPAKQKKKAAAAATKAAGGNKKR